MKSGQVWLLFLVLVVISVQLGMLVGQTFPPDPLDDVEDGPERRREDQGGHRPMSMTSATSDRAARLPRSLKRLGFDLVDAVRRGRFHITREGAKVNATADLFGLDLAGVEAWIREKVQAP